VNGDGGSVQLASPRPLIQRLNVFQPMFKAIAPQIDFVRPDRVEQKRAVRIGPMAKSKGFCGIFFVIWNSSFRPYLRLVAIQSAV